MFVKVKIEFFVIMLISCVFNAQVHFTSIPVDLQLIPRNKNNIGTFKLEGKCLAGNYQMLRTKLVITATGTAIADSITIINMDSTFSVTHNIPAQLKEYDLEIYLKNTNSEVFIKKVVRLTAGDYFIISGQSNALAPSGFDQAGIAQNDSYSKTWLRGIGSHEDGGLSTYPCSPLDTNFYQANAIWLQNGFVGTWGLKLQHELAQQTGIPNCIINGARAGSSINENLAPKTPTNPDSLNPCSLYDKTYKKISHYNLNESIKAIFWYQGETDVWSINETNEYTNRFHTLYNSWKLDYPNIEKIFILQLNTGCNETNLSQMREVQRKLAHAYNDVIIMSTFSSDTADRSYDHCHYTVQGYNKIADNLLPLVKKYIYGNTIDKSITQAPDIIKAYISAPSQLCIEFDTDVSFEDSKDYLYPHAGTAYLKDYFYCENYKQIGVESLSSQDNKLYLNLNPDSVLPKKITYLPHSFTQIPTLYVGPWILNKNNSNITALSFFEFPVINSGDNLFDIYPNPSSGPINVMLSEKNTNTTVSIFDTMGKLIFQQRNQNEKNLELNLGLPKGMYIIKVENDLGSVNKKVIFK